MNANERRLAVLEALCARRHDSVENLAFEFGVSVRTIKYDVEALTLSYPIDESYTQTRQLSSDMLQEIVLSMTDSWEYQDNAREVIGELADKGYTTATRILGYLNKEYKGVYDFTLSTAQKIELLFSVLQKYPTTYFEAKPQRAVGLDEIQAVLLPKKTSVKLVNALDDNGISYQYYGEESERSEIIQKMDGIRFSLSETDSEGDTLSPEEQGTIRHSKTAKITADMSDEDRYNVLKDKSLVLNEPSALSEYMDEEDITKLSEAIKSRAEKYIYPLAERLGLHKVDYKNSSLDFGFGFSKNGGLKESLSKQKDAGGNYADFAKVLTCLDKVVKNAELIEVHSDKYVGTVREDRTLRRTYVLMGCVNDGNDLIPVQFEVKEKIGTNNQLYLTVALTKIKDVVLGNTESENAFETTLFTSFSEGISATPNISISDLLTKINPLDEDFLKYVPDGFLSEEQKIGKQRGIRKEKAKIAELKNGVRSSITDTAESKVMLDMPKPLKSGRKAQAKEGIENTHISFVTNWVNVHAGIERYGKALGVSDIDATTNFARSANAAANHKIERELRPVFEGIRHGKKNKADNTQYATHFFAYLLHNHNVDRMAAGVKKPVFDKDVSVADSKAEIARYEKIHPEFKKEAEKVWQYNRDLLKQELDAGLIPQDLYDELTKKYPHYVPTLRDKDGVQQAGAVKGKSMIEINSSVKSATGSSLPIFPIDVVMARRTMTVMRATRVNGIAKALYHAALDKGDSSRVEFNGRSKIEGEIDYDADRPKNNQVTFYENGERITISVSKDIFAGFDAFSSSAFDMWDNPVLRITTRWNSVFKKLVTAWNPFFTVRNAVRDLQEAGLYTRAGWKLFFKNLGVAYKQIAFNGNYWREYQEMGGLNSSVFDYEKGYKRSKKGLGVVLEKIEMINVVVEQAPRLSEYISAREQGLSVERALLNAADVTVNFGRSGAFAKKLNSTVIPFLNPSIQGFDKLIRTVVGKKTAKEWFSLVMRAAMLGIAASMLNDLLLDDDEEYKALRQSDKENNFIFKIGQGKFLKLPKGRVSAVLSQFYYVGKQVAKGEKVDYKGEISTARSALSPVETASRFIWSPFTDTASNTTWYGSAIESAKFENYAPRDRYDENTSSIAIWIGKQLNYSPKKIHYLMDQYSGIIGDVLLPATTKTAERGIVEKNFTLDSTSQSKYSNEFYEEIEQAMYASNDGDLYAEARLKYLNKVKYKITQLNKEKQAIQNSDLSNKEKQAQVKALQILINNTQKSAVINADIFSTVLSKYDITADTYEAVYMQAYRETFGAQAALEQYNNSVYAKATALNASGIDYELYFDAYFYLRELTSDKDKKGNTIAGSKKKKALAYVNKLKISKLQKAILLASVGYHLDEATTKQVSKYAKTLDATSFEIILDLVA